MSMCVCARAHIPAWKHENGTRACAQLSYLHAGGKQVAGLPTDRLPRSQKSNQAITPTHCSPFSLPVSFP